MEAKLELWIATGNKGKLHEFTQLLADLPIKIHGQHELEVFSPPPEDGDSFLANARIKAKALNAMKSDQWVIADDSGLVVDGLGGLPGIHSARYAGAQASPAENNAKLLKMVQIRCSANRKAHFHCTLVAISPKGEEFSFDGKLEGTITKQQAGKNGFGYDPVFCPKGSDKSLAELTPGEKNKVSHRYQAAQKFLELLKDKL